MPSPATPSDNGQLSPTVRSVLSLVLVLHFACVFTVLASTYLRSELQRRLDRPDHAAVAKSISEVGFPSAIELLATYAGHGPDLAPWLKDAEINRDRNLRLQYLAGLGLNSYLDVPIYDDMLAYRKFPEKLFTGSEERLRELRHAIRRKRSDQ